MKLKYGLNPNISNSDYHADRHFLSSSGLKLLLDDEEAFKNKYILGNFTNEENSAFSFGTYIHTMLLEPHLLEAETAVYGGGIRRGSKWDAFKSENKGKTIITESEHEKALKMLENYNYLPRSVQLISNGRSEETFAGELLGIPLKVRFDSVGNGYGLDVKTTSFPCDIQSLMETIDKYDYALSAALYVEIARICGETINDFYFLFANKKTCDITLVSVSKRFLEDGRNQVFKAIEKYKKLEAEGFFDLTPLLTIEETTEELK